MEDIKVIFLDYNGVLDTYENMDIIDDENFKILKYIVNETKSNIVISSSLKNTYYYSGKHNQRMLNLLIKLKEENIIVHGITKNLGDREEEIKDYLLDNPNIVNYCILDDDYYFKSMKDHMVKLKEQFKGGNGLKEANIQEIIDILNKI